MTVNTQTMNAVLSGSVVFASANIRALLTQDPNADNCNFVSELSSVDYYSTPYNTALSADTGSYNNTKGVYLSASSCLFSTISTDYTDKDVYIINYNDTGDLNTSNIISYQLENSPVIAGDTSFTISDNKIINLTDGATSYKALFRSFRENLLGGIGNIANLSVACALMSSSYTPSITSTTYDSISSHIVTSAPIPGLYIDNGALKTTQTFIPFPISTGFISSAVLFISSVTIENSILMGYYSTNNSLSPATLTATSTNAYLRFFNKTLFSLI